MTDSLCGLGSYALRGLVFIVSLMRASVVLDDQLTSSSIQPSAASLALEVLSLLMVDQNLQVVEISFTVVAPGPLQYLLGGWVILLLPHRDVICRSKGLGRFKEVTSLMWASKGCPATTESNGRCGSGCVYEQREAGLLGWWSS